MLQETLFIIMANAASKMRKEIGVPLGALEMPFTLLTLVDILDSYQFIKEELGDDFALDLHGGG
jgi:hypothetical protein